MSGPAVLRVIQCTGTAVALTPLSIPAPFVDPTAIPVFGAQVPVPGSPSTSPPAHGNDAPTQSYADIGQHRID